MQRFNLGHTVAPPRFIAFGFVFVVGLATAIPALGWSRGAMAAFDAASLVFLVLISSLLRDVQIDTIRHAARNNDANRAGLLVLTGVTMLTILVAVFKELQGKNDLKIIALVIATLVLSWLFSNTVYALHYAHMYYSEAEGKDSGGLDIPKCDEPDYWDFLYFSFTLGMTFQTSDVEITSRRIRRVVLGQCLAAFVFNLGVLAFTINTLGSAGN
ncbi:DUF1345 domain-containing protein [Sphingomonas populi]|uniref:DUF1345 domain-containing protein n=1 Tax=Sphingomonas populi TaxID=2484750 RepID=A0A4V2DCE2_9SPHN|nr:DUF1345 domain-containing protein [Sphingomonas populi]RZF61178.1 DUF1345 domain-containing protein [Sphingomonas populi]